MPLRGQGLVEYGLIIALVAVLAIAGLIIFGPAVGESAEQRQRLCLAQFALALGCAPHAAPSRTWRAAECVSALILVPIDLSPIGDAKLPVVEQYARWLDADVVLLHVLPSGELDPSAVSPREATARTYLDTVAARLRNAGLRAETILRSGAPAAIILEEAPRARSS